MSPEVRAFVDLYKQQTKCKQTPTVTINELIKQHNHEIWKTCNDCFHVFDLRKENEIACPKCSSTNLK